jgi:hypothetical protein
MSAPRTLQDMSPQGGGTAGGQVDEGANSASLRQVDELSPVGVVGGDHAARVKPPVQVEVAAVKSRGDGWDDGKVLELHEDVHPRRFEEKLLPPKSAAVRGDDLQRLSRGAKTYCEGRRDLILVGRQERFDHAAVRVAADDDVPGLVKGHRALDVTRVFKLGVRGRGEISKILEHVRLTEIRRNQVERVGRHVGTRDDQRPGGTAAVRQAEQGV